MKRDIKEFWSWIKTVADYKPSYLQVAVFCWTVAFFALALMGIGALC